MKMMRIWMCFLAGMAVAFASPVVGAAIGLSQNGRSFVDENGKPFFWQGDTEWELFRNFSPADARQLLRQRRSQGFNAIQVMVMGVPPESSSLPGMAAWLNNNPLTPNEEYFKRVDSIVVAAAESRIILVIGVYHARDSDAGRITVANAKPWAKWLAHRYRSATNVVWSMYPHAAAASGPVARATAQGLAEGDGGAHLITMHPDPSPASSSFMHSEPWLAFNTVQTFDSALLNYRLTAADHARTPAKPVVDGEARYEDGAGIMPRDIRRGAYLACLAGGFYSYGNDGNWRSPSTWREWIDSPGALQIKVLGDLFRSIQWWELVPDQSIFAGEAGENAAARSASGRWMMAYLSHNRAVTLQLDKIGGPGSVAASWVDPITGATTRIGVFPATGRQTFSPPREWQDSILLIARQ